MKTFLLAFLFMFSQDARSAVVHSCPWLAETYLQKSVLQEMDPSDRLALEITFRRAYEHPNEKLSEIEMNYVRQFELESAIAKSQDAGRDLLKKQKNSKLLTQGAVVAGAGVLSAFLYPTLYKHYLSIFHQEKSLNLLYGFHLSRNPRPLVDLLKNQMGCTLKSTPTIFKDRPSLTKTDSAKEVSLRLLLDPDENHSNVSQMSPADRDAAYNTYYNLWHSQGVVLCSDFSRPGATSYSVDDLQNINSVLSHLSPVIRQLLGVRWVVLGSDQATKGIQGDTLKINNVSDFKDAVAAAILESPMKFLLMTQSYDAKYLPPPYENVDSFNSKFISDAIHCAWNEKCHAEFKKSDPKFCNAVDSFLSGDMNTAAMPKQLQDLAPQLQNMTR